MSPDWQPYVRYRYKLGVPVPVGVEVGRCYDALPSSGPAPRPALVDLLDENGVVIAREVNAWRDLERCSEDDRR